MMKTALCGVWHVHADEYIAHAKELTQVVGVWDSNEEALKAFCEKYALKAFASLDELLASNAESVMVCSASNEHADHMIRIAEAKKHIFTEKVLCLTLEDCLRVKKAVEQNGVKFVISLFQKYRGKMQAVKQIVESGELGRINFVRFTNCHSGSVKDWLPDHFYNREQCGGGAMIDLGAHGMYLIHWLTEKLPVSYQSTFTVWDNNPRNKDRVEDNAVTAMTFDDGCIAINETGFVTRSRPVALEVCGEFGSVFVNGNTVTKQIEKETFPVDVPEDLPRPIIQFLTDEILDGCGMEEALALTQMMEGAYKE